MTRRSSVTYDLSVDCQDYWAVGSGWEYARTALHRASRGETGNSLRTGT